MSNEELVLRKGYAPAGMDLRPSGIQTRHALDAATNDVSRAERSAAEHDREMKEQFAKMQRELEAKNQAQHKVANNKDNAVELSNDKDRGI